MNRYGNLIRLHSWKVDEKRRTLTDIERLKAEMQARLGRLETEHEHEKLVAQGSPAAGRSFVAYAVDVRRRRQAFNQSIVDLDKQIGIAREAVAEAFGELKKFETISANRRRQIRQRDVRREQASLDEIAIEMFRRREL